MLMILFDLSSLKKSQTDLIPSFKSFNFLCAAMADLAINFSLSLVEQIINFTNHELNFHGNVAGDIADVKAQLKRMQSIVQGGGVGSSQVEEVLVQSLRLVGYRIEDALDGIMLHGPRHSPNNKLLRKGYELGHSLWHRSSLQEIHEEIQRIQHEMDNIHQTLVVSPSHCETPKTELQHHLTQTLQDAEILGTDVLKQKLMSQLINTGERDCVAVVVVGPPGSGKTVLANSVYSGKQVSDHFSCRVRIRLSRCFDVNYLLSLLLSQCCDGEISLTVDPVTKLRNNLQGKRYLVILDDVWSEKHWRDIRHALPDNLNGSRVVITTTKLDVASSIATSPRHIHQVEGLQEEESWQLFCRKAFLEEKGGCPPDLEDLSRKIVSRCESSPLAISAVGGLLAPKQRWPAEWRKVHENLIGEREINPHFSDLNNSLLRSYDDLHGNLKSCLLYFSLFPQGCYIERARLIRLWVAERFVNETREKPAEEIAEEYLDELIKRNLVVANRDFDGRVKTCSVRIFLHYFLTIKSRKEDFADVLDKPSTTPGENVRRLSVADAFSNGERVSGMRLNRVCSSIMFGGFSPPQIREVCNQFKSLKVLDFQGAPLQNFPECVVDLGLLRYLSLRGSSCVSKVPSSIKKLRYLEFLDLKFTSVAFLPKEICLLRNLQHLLVYQYRMATYVTTYVTFDSVQGMRMTGEIGFLSSLRKLTLLKAENHQKFFDQLGNLTQLQKLGLIELRSVDGKFLCASLAKMKNISVLDLRSLNRSEFLDLDYPLFPCNMLQRVYLKGPLLNLPGWIKSLKSLLRIHLKWSRLTTSPIDELQGLNNLIELHLVDAFIGSKLVFPRGTFEKLKVLHLEDLSELSIVEVSRGSMRNLQRLALINCTQLKVPPSGISYLSVLKDLELVDMPVELTNSIREGGLDRAKIKVHYTAN